MLSNFVAALAAYAPATGQTVSPWPFILLGIAVVLVIGLALISILGKNKKNK